MHYGKSLKPFDNHAQSVVQSDARPSLVASVQFGQKGAKMSMLVLSIATASLFAVNSSSAQGTATAYVQLTDGVSCGNGNGEPTFAYASCAMGQGDNSAGTAAAFADRGTLRTTGSISQTNSSGTQPSVVSFADAFWSDVLTISGPVRPNSIRFLTSITGVQSYVLQSPNSGFSATSFFRMRQVQNTGQTSFTNLNFNWSAFGDRTTTLTTAKRLITEFAVLDAILGSNFQSMNVSMELYNFLVVGAGNFPRTPIQVGAAQDFGNTVKLVGLFAFDASGNDITNQATFSWARGTIVDNGLALVPEPTTLALELVGLAALLVFLTLRQRRAHYPE